MISLSEEMGLPDAVQSSDAVGWLQLAVLSLALAGILALSLVLSRTPGLEALFPGVDFFRAALVIHVDQSVLVWFLTMNAVIWCLADFTEDVRFLHRLSLGLAVLATIGLALAPFTGDAKPLMNNYVPVLQSVFFFAILGLFATAVMLRFVLAARCIEWRKVVLAQASLLQMAAATSGIAFAMALLAVGWSWSAIPVEISGTLYFEYLFWGAGHTLQFAHVQLLMYCWLVLSMISGVTLAVDLRAHKALLLLGILPLVLVPVIYLSYSVESGEFRRAFTQLMQWGSGLGIVPLGLLLLWDLARSKASDLSDPVLRLTLWMSMLLFFAGGLLGIVISGLNTVIPAHYHGSIVGITLALMGLAYLLLPRLGYQVVSGRLACAQPLCYGIGQLLHIAGLGVSGAMGIQRKTAGAEQGLDSLASQLAMGVMGLGGLLAVTGGALFVWLMLSAFWKGRVTHS